MTSDSLRVVYPQHQSGLTALRAQGRSPAGRPEQGNPPLPDRA